MPPAPPHSQSREWLNSLLFAVVVSTLIRWSAVEAYVIPSESMKHSLLVGDYLLVSKLHYGPVMPQMPLQIPLTHQTVLGFKSYSDLIQLPADMRTFLVKRCIAVAGDTLAIRQGQVYLNGRAEAGAGQPQTTYFMAVAHPNDAVRQALHDQGVADYAQPDGQPAATTTTSGQTGYFISCPAGVAA